MARTDVIPVEKDETAQGLIRKVRDSLGTRVIIFSDSRIPVLRSEINLRLLNFYSEEEGKELVLVVKDRYVRRLAKNLGIKVEDKIEEAETGFYQNQLPMELNGFTREAVSVGDERVPRPIRSFSGGRLVMALVFTFFSLLVATYFLFRPKVNIIIHPASKEHLFSAGGKVGMGYSEREITKGVLPLKVVEKQDELTVSISTSGRKRVGYLPAKGMVVFINSGVNPIIVPKGTMVSTKGGLSFFTTKPVVVPKKSTNYVQGIPTGEIYGQAEVEVEATEKGTIGNVEKQMISKIEGHLANTLHVANFKSFTSGEDKLVPIVEEQDILRAEEEAKRQLELKAKDEVQAMVEEGYLLLPELVQTEAGKVRPEQPIGTETSTLSVRLSYKVKTASLNKTHLYKWFEHNLYQTLPDGFLPITNEITCRGIKVNGDLKQADISVQAVAKVRGKIDRQKIFKAVAGKSLLQAKNSLADFPEIGFVEFSGNNDLKRIPNHIFQVRMIVPSEK